MWHYTIEMKKLNPNPVLLKEAEMQLREALLKGNISPSDNAEMALTCVYLAQRDEEWHDYTLFEPVKNYTSIILELDKVQRAGRGFTPLEKALFGILFDDLAAYYEKVCGNIPPRNRPYDTESDYAYNCWIDLLKAILITMTEGND
jgi:hypothetical protein